MTVAGYETHTHTKIFTEILLATDETEKYTDVYIILAQLSSGTVAGTENRINKLLLCNYKVMERLT